MRITCLLLLSAGLAAAAPLFDCDFICDSPGTANQSVCAPVAGHISVQVDQAFGIAHVGYDAWNGTILRTIVFYLDDLTVDSHTVNLHSNGDSTSFFVAHIAPFQLIEVQAIVDGIGGPGRLTSFTATACCAPVPEPATASLFLLGVAIAGVGRARRKWWLR